MRRWKKILLAAALCAALALGIAIPASGSSGTVYLMAVNEKVQPLTAENMPTIMGGVLYVPYTMLSFRDSGINLRMSALYSTSRRTVLVSSGQNGILFDIQNNTAEDLQGNPVPARAMVRNSMAFVPIDYLCSFFGTISCSRVRTDYGILIRVTNSAAVLRDADFVDAASNLLADSLRQYQASIETPTPQPTPVPTTPAAIEPTVPPANPTPPPSAQPPESPGPSESPGLQAELLLALRWGEQGGEIAQLLEDRGECALFLFTCEELRAQDDAVRRVAAAGHTVGLALTGEDAEACTVQLEEGRRLLAEIARYHVLIVSADALDSGGREALAQVGCVVWRPDLRGEDYRSGTAVVEDLNPQRANYVELTCGAGSAVLLRSILTAADGERCYLRQATVPLLV